MSSIFIRTRQDHFGALQSLLRGDTEDLAGVSRALGIPDTDIVAAVAEYAGSADYAGDAQQVMETLDVRSDAVLTHAGADPDCRRRGLLETLLERGLAARTGGEEQGPEDLGDVTMAVESFRGLEEHRQRHTYLVGRIVADRYWLEVPVGEGSFGVVYRARDTRLDAPVAVKVMRRKPERHELMEGRAPSLHSMVRAPERAEAPGLDFRREAWLMAILRHPAIVPAYDFGWVDDQHYFIAMKLCATDLAREARHLAVPRIVAIVARIAEAVAAMHHQRVLHRDVKPANILLDDAGRPFLSDLGLALPFDRDREGFAGTPTFMSPEQFTHWYDARADVYALGVTLYHALTGEIPFGREVFRGVGSDPDQLRRSLEQARVAPPSTLREEVDDALSDLVLAAMAPRVPERVPSAAHLAQALRDWLRDRPEASRVAAAPDPAPTSGPYAPVEAARERLDEASRGGDPARTARATLDLAARHAELGGLKPALLHFDRALRLFARRGDDRGRADALWLQALTLRRLGHGARAREDAAQALALHRRLGSEVADAIAGELDSWSDAAED